MDGQARRALERQGEFARRHRPEIARRETEKAQPRRDRFVPRKSRVPPRAAYFPGAGVSAMAATPWPKVAVSSRTTIST
jgi:hypothetical protein